MVENGGSYNKFKTGKQGKESSCILLRVLSVGVPRS